jgi:2-dehydro-3-deoxyphosphogalactonate aldolase
LGTSNLRVEVHGKHALIGAGTVLDTMQVDAVADVGGKLIVSPNTNPKVIAHTVTRGLQSWPGAFRPIECFAAIHAGASGLKLFPGYVLGISGLKAIRPILQQDTRIYALGGASANNFAEWIVLSADWVGLGSGIYKLKIAQTTSPKNAAAIVASDDEAIDDF